MITVGIDLATEAAGTAIATVEWATDHARLVEVRIPASDDDIVAAIGVATKAGVDCPLGWPVAFIDFVNAQRGGVVRRPPGVSTRRRGSS